jgi:periplasmic copper chaperone A
MRKRLTAALCGATLLALSVPASAHVTVQGPGATQGGFTKLTFRVPTEKDVPTTRLEIVFPAEAPIASVRVKPHQGWTAALTKGKPAKPLKAFGEDVTEVVTKITWTVNAGNKGIGVTEFDEFDVSAGPLPEVDQLTFKALQTYADGEVVRWIEDRIEGADEPEHPAPVLKLAKATETSGATPAPSPAATVKASADQDDDEDRLGAIGLGVGVLALLIALGAFVRSGRRQA